jgi:imidazole glycerol-phosphate synthase subunit HisH
MRRVAIIDYGLCNLDSIGRAVEECGGQPLVTSRPEDLRTVGAIIIPGVGAFPDAMANLRSTGMAGALREESISSRVPVLGICLGMQLLADRGTEVRPADGLGLIPGEVRRLTPFNPRERIPHVGWNEVAHDRTCPILSEVPSGTDFYFVHSFHLICGDPSHVAGITPHADGFTSVVWRDQVFGVQFHPEKSQTAGFRVLTNFLRV